MSFWGENCDFSGKSAVELENRNQKQAFFGPLDHLQWIGWPENACF
jgi:hypothetical protein